MELRHLTTFEAVARLGSFTAAARELHLAQSAVSAQVKRLEEELRTPLLARTTRHVALTHAGELLLARARRVLAEVDGARSDLAGLAAVLRGRITLGATDILGTFDLPTALAAFHRRHPGVDLALRSDLVARLVDALDAGDLDLVLGPLHPDLPERCVARAVASEQHLLVTPPGHRLAERAEVALREVAAEPFVCLRPGSGLHAILTAAAAEAGVVLRVPFETHSPHSIRALVSAGLGVAVMARSAAVGPGAPVTVHTLDPAPPPLPIGVIHRRDRRLTPAARALRRHLLTAAAPTSGG